MKIQCRFKRSELYMNIIYLKNKDTRETEVLDLDELKILLKESENENIKK